MGTPEISNSRPDAREAALAAKEASLEGALAMTNAAFSILGSRALVILSAAASASAWAYVLVAAPAYGVISAALVTAMLFWPALWMDRRGS